MLSLVTHAKPKLVTATIANGASQSQLIDLQDVVAGGWFTPAALTNVGAVNLMRFGVSNNYGDPSGTAITALLPSTAIATAQSQQQSVSAFYPLPLDVLKHRFFRFDGVTTEAAARSLQLMLWQSEVQWRRYDATIASGQTATEAIKFNGARGGSFLIPAAFTGTTVTFQVSADGGSYTTLKTTADANISQGVAVNRWIPFPDGVFAFAYVKIVSGSAEAAARQIRCDFKEF